MIKITNNVVARKYCTTTTTTITTTTTNVEMDLGVGSEVCHNMNEILFDWETA